MSRAIATDLSSAFKLNDGVTIPWFGLGVFRSPRGETTEHAVSFALRNGYRMIDTAQIYQNEQSVGRGIRHSGVSRDDVYVVSKVWNDLHGYERTTRSVMDSLSRLEMSYVDMFLIHSPGGGKNIETYQALLDLKSKGLIQSVGVSNFGVPHLQGLHDAGLPTPSVNQIELHAFHRKNTIVKYCQDNGIAVMGYSPLAQGRKLDDQDLVEIATRLNKSAAQVMIRWSVQSGYITIPKSTKEDRILSNAAVFDFELSEEDMTVLSLKPKVTCGWNPTLLPWQG